MYFAAKINMIGRSNEVKQLEKLYLTKKAELVAAYGKRREEKKYLINETFKNKFFFK